MSLLDTNSGNNLGLPLWQVPFVDLKTGRITREWWPFLNDLYNRVGGPVAPSITDIVYDIKNINIPIFLEDSSSNEDFAIPGMQGVPGPKGDPGTPGFIGGVTEIGEQGEDGAMGPPGIPGLRGLQGYQGVPGSQGEDGEDGAAGPPGMAGAAGAAGANGAPGIQGPPGADGTDGEDGASGLPGPTGATGPMGAMGAPGTAGRDGDDGEDGYPGIQGPRGLQGAPGSASQLISDDMFAEDTQSEAMSMTNLNQNGNPTYNTLRMTSTITPNSLAGIVGTTTNDSANAGSVGEIISSNQTTPQSLTSGVVSVITSISLTAGQWLVFGTVEYTPDTSTVMSKIASAASASPTVFSPSIDAEQLTITFTAGGAGVLQRVSVPTQVLQLASTTTSYLLARPVFTTSTCTALGKITAVRMR